ncbi:hypothetical protein Dimus_015956 [Dionaea muscipula]
MPPIAEEGSSVEENLSMSVVAADLTSFAPPEELAPTADSQPLLCSPTEGFPSPMADVLSDNFHGDSVGRRGKDMLGSSIFPGVGDLVAADALLQPLSTVSPSPSSLSGNESVHRDGGMVSEEVRDSPTAREAVRPRLIDGSRWHPLSPVKQYPVLEVVEMRRGGMLMGPGRSFNGEELGKAQQLLSTAMVVATVLCPGG